MTNTTLLYAGILLIGVFLSAISQVMLKKAAARQYVSKAIPYNWTRVIVEEILCTDEARFCGNT